MAKLADVQILKVGKWKGEDFTSDYLDDLIAAANEVDFKIPVKLGHDKSPSAPAVGWVTNLRRVNDVLIADFVDIPKSVFSMIKEKMFDQVSVEILVNLNRVGKTFKRALGAVALLGASIPAVEGLKPLSSLLSLEFEAVVTPLGVDLNPKGADKMDDMKELLAAAERRLAEQHKSNNEKAEQIKALSEALDKLKADLTTERTTFSAKITALQEERAQDRIESKVKSVTIPSLQEAIRNCYNIAMAVGEGTTVKVFDAEKKAFEDRNPESLVDALVHQLNAVSEKIFKEHSTTTKKTLSNETAGIELDRKVRDYIEKNKGADYMAAQRIVLNADEDLKKRYALEG